MEIRKKLKVISKTLNLTQTKLAEKFGVSFVAFNRWWKGKATPRPKMQGKIDDLFLEVTGQKTVPQSILKEKKDLLEKKKYKNVVKDILSNPDIKDQFVLKLTYNSNRIEGSTLTEPETFALLFDDVALTNRSLVEQLEAKNHQAALNYLFDHISKGGVVNEDFILKLHAILMNSVRSDAGAYRSHPVRIAGVNLPTVNHLKIPDLVPQTLKRKKKDIISLVTEVHSEFERIHPFSDGNGRVGRLLMNAMLLKNDFAPAIILQNQKQLYIQLSL